MVPVSGRTTGVPQSGKTAPTSPADTGSSPRLRWPHLKNPVPPSPRFALCPSSPSPRERGTLPQGAGPLLPSAFQGENCFGGCHRPAGAGAGERGLLRGALLVAAGRHTGPGAAAGLLSGRGAGTGPGAGAGAGRAG